ncbi:hypothetical protein ACFQY4_05400 [Catellatospora bangladeshensis]|uniref:Uncharacterized protein n=1 Tax=Catellatospora bangladeshensis TaxID=310355 RepID=A0A8J3JQE2_9ACTN|nr:hypothetical protein [Catellatospora bangladeshensis]GIF83145.1 hypothetical protein Cba03nite_44940 [Catellatospora bangladeshensis]
MRLHLTADHYERVLRYLAAPTERIAFIYTRPAADGPDQHGVEVELLHDDEYTASDRHGVELADHVRPQLIRTAHEHDYGIVEAHAHLWRGPRTQFSDIDLDGLRELGPHMTWRLPGRPYIALVLGPDSFDALSWQTCSPASGIDALVAGEQVMYPTGRSGARLEAERS